MKQQILMGLMAFLMCLCCVFTSAFAAEDGTVGYGVATNNPLNAVTSSQSSEGGQQQDHGTVKDEKTAGSESGSLSDGIKSADEVLGMNKGNVVTTQDVDNWVSRKGNDLISIITHVVQIVCVLCFFAALFMVVIGAVGNGKTMVAGLIALAISCATFTAATCGPMIIAAVQSWLSH